tara:strand:- start:63 stop:176 length:114 start_codon:yes stop_codon:yes gene_type:complete
MFFQNMMRVFCALRQMKKRPGFRKKKNIACMNCFYVG